MGRCSTRLLRDSTERRCGAFTSGLGHSGVSIVWASAVTCGGVTGDASTVAAEDPFQRFAVTCGNVVEDASTVAAEEAFQRFAATCGNVVWDASTVAVEGDFHRFAVTWGDVPKDSTSVAAEDAVHRFATSSCAILEGGATAVVASKLDQPRKKLCRP